MSNKCHAKISVRSDHRISIESDHLSLEALRKDFTWYVPGAHFTPSFKDKNWDGKKCFIGGGLAVAHAAAGLSYDVKRWFTQRGYELEYEDYRTPFKISKLNPKMGNIELYRYQMEAAWMCLRIGGGIIKLPTGSGKSAVITAVVKHAMALDPDVLFVVMVPRSSLVLQFYDEMVNEYGIDKKYIGKWDGKNKTWKNQPILITTRQSLQIRRTGKGRNKVEELREVTEKVMDHNRVMMFIDECHESTCDTVTELLTLIDPMWRFGFTGTLPETKIDQMELIGLLGNVLYSKKTMDLIKLGYLPPLDITVVQLEHNKKKFKKYMDDLEIADLEAIADDAGEETGEEEEEPKNLKYLREIDYISNDELRNKLINKIVQSYTKNGKNVLILVERIAHGQTIQQYIPGSIFLHGKDSAKVRYEIQKQCEEKSGIPIIATSGIFSMGVSIKRLHGVVLAGISSAKVTLLQSIGRGLRKHKTKKQLKVYDIADSTQYAKRHIKNRLKVFDNEGFLYKIISV